MSKEYLSAADGLAVDDDRCAWSGEDAELFDSAQLCPCSLPSVIFEMPQSWQGVPRWKAQRKCLDEPVLPH
jgi:hypothetical protein